MMAIKGARAWTGRPKIAKFEGAYHGSYDYAEVSLGSSPENWGNLAAPASTAYSRGVPRVTLGVDAESPTAEKAIVQRVTNTTS